VIDDNSIFKRGDLYGLKILFHHGSTSAVIYQSTTTDLKDPNVEHGISIKRVIFGYYEVPATGAVEFWGPYTIEVRVWKLP
jgi:hypothetical protein